VGSAWLVVVAAAPSEKTPALPRDVVERADHVGERGPIGGLRQTKSTVPPALGDQYAGVAQRVEDLGEVVGRHGQPVGEVAGPDQLVARVPR
jgi:hypothetical protein